MANDLINCSCDELRQKLKSSNNPEEIKNIVQLFNSNLKKKELIRADILSDLQDKITDQMYKRISTNSDTFSNKDLLDYLGHIQNILDSQKKEESQTIPSIAIQNNIMLGKEELDVDSRDKIKEVISRILNNKSEQTDTIIENEEAIND